MLQILSTSNETSTGTELVQNGNFSQLGADLVENGLFDELGTDVITNGSFATDTDWTKGNGWSIAGKAISTQALGSEEVTNGNFSDVPLGSELIDDGDFPSPNVNWTIQGGASTTWVINNNTATRTGSANWGLYQNITRTIGSLYKITFNVSTYTSGTLKVKLGNGVANDVTTSGSKTLYMVWDGSLEKISFEGTFIGSIENVSVKEVINLVDNPNFTDTGAEEIVDGDFPLPNTAWATGGGSEITIDGARINNTVTGANSYILQYLSGTPSGKQFVLSYDVITTNGTTLGLEQNSALILNTSTTGTNRKLYFTWDRATNAVIIKRLTSGTDVTIDNVSVKELGEDWTLGTGWSIGDSKAVCDGTQVANSNLYQAVYTISNSYKTTIDVIVTGGTLKIFTGTPSQTITITSSGTYDFSGASSSSSTLYIQAPVGFSGSVSNISVQELGEGWTLGTGWSIGEDKAVSDGSSSNLIQSITGSTNKYFKLVFTISDFVSGVVKPGFVGKTQTPYYANGTYTEYIESGTDVRFVFYSILFEGSITDISVKEIATSYLTQAVSLSAKTWKIIYSVSDYIAGSVSATDYGAVTTADAVGITEYVEIGATSDFRMVNIDGYFEGAVTDISAQLVDPNGYWTLGAGWSIGEDVAISDGSVGSITQSILTADVFYKIRIKVTGNPTLLVFSSTSFYGDEAARTLKNGTHIYYLQAKVATFSITNEGSDACTITNISSEQVDPNDYWTLGTGWSIGTDKAISTVTGSNSDITQSILTAGKTYRTVYEIVDYDAGTAQAIVTGSDGSDAVALGTYTEDLTTTGTDFSIRSKLGTFDGAVSSVSVKQLGTYEDQSIYVTAADVQTIAQASVYYLIELTSMGSKNSLYFLPSSVVPNNGRYTKLNFTVISKDAIQQPTLGIISFYDSVGGLDTYPMGFYEFRIYEQTSSTNLDPLLATGLLEKGFAFVRDFSGNMQELTDGFKEYNPALTQYVYSK